MPAERPFLDELKIAFASRVAVCLNTVLSGLTRKIVPRPFYAERRRRGEPGRCMYAIWHAHLWHVTDALKGQGVFAMVSRHRDGEIIARVLARKGFKLLRGSRSLSIIGIAGFGPGRPPCDAVRRRRIARQLCAIEVGPVCSANRDPS